ncbi:hypothetical protein Cflav_PD6508 [Pedosphaera parvula Ellin514]|uniref:Uncharacterized protein n=1 Tax=Pedosphaera parvula (strain Ellin514) TaxID=320771 RepID=B9XSS9_PEDPL|nr:hypothetical protein Cflav_PD6508 [Pedosphaera parvula Ellin514]
MLVIMRVGMLMPLLVFMMMVTRLLFMRVNMLMLSVLMPMLVGASMRMRVCVCHSATVGMLVFVLMVMAVAVAMLMTQVHIEFDPINVGFLPPPDMKMISIKTQFLQFMLQPMLIHTQIDQRTDQHVATDAAENVQIQSFHMCPPEQPPQLGSNLRPPTSYFVPLKR